MNILDHQQQLIRFMLLNQIVQNLNSNQQNILYDKRTHKKRVKNSILIYFLASHNINASIYIFFIFIEF